MATFSMLHNSAKICYSTILQNHPCRIPLLIAFPMGGRVGHMNSKPIHVLLYSIADCIPKSTSLEFPSLGAQCTRGLPQLNPGLPKDKVNCKLSCVNPGCTDVENSKEVDSGARFKTSGQLCHRRSTSPPPPTAPPLTWKNHLVMGGGEPACRHGRWRGARTGWRTSPPSEVICATGLGEGVFVTTWELRPSP